MKILITGAGGQLGLTLQHLAPREHEIVPLTSRQLDITNRNAVLETVRKIRPDVIINAAAYTAVDKAESEPERAHAINALGPEYLARAAAENHCRLIHVSTDFVFDGKKCTPYTPEDTPNPLNVYGRTKLEGEQRIRKILPENSLIIRTAWVYSQVGHNFLNTMIRLMQEKETLHVVADQFGTPTWTFSLARMLLACTKKPDLSGLLHYTDNGSASWYDFAVSIYDILSARIPNLACRTITPIPSREYPTPATRPGFTVLDKTQAIKATGIMPPHWQHHLRLCLHQQDHPQS